MLTVVKYLCCLSPTVPFGSSIDSWLWQPFWNSCNTNICINKRLILSLLFQKTKISTTQTSLKVISCWRRSKKTLNCEAPSNGICGQGEFLFTSLVQEYVSICVQNLISVMSRVKHSTDSSKHTLSHKANLLGDTQLISKSWIDSFCCISSLFYATKELQRV